MISKWKDIDPLNSFQPLVYVKKCSKLINTKTKKQTPSRKSSKEIRWIKIWANQNDQTAKVAAFLNGGLGSGNGQQKSPRDIQVWDFLFAQSLTWNLKVMVSKFGISYSRGLIFRWTMLNFGRVTDPIWRAYIFRWVALQPPTRWLCSFWGYSLNHPILDFQVAAPRRLNDGAGSWIPMKILPGRYRNPVWAKNLWEEYGMIQSTTRIT